MLLPTKFGEDQSSNKIWPPFDPHLTPSGGQTGDSKSKNCKSNERLFNNLQKRSFTPNLVKIRAQIRFDPHDPILTPFNPPFDPLKGSLSSNLTSDLFMLSQELPLVQISLRLLDGKVEYSKCWRLNFQKMFPFLPDFHQSRFWNLGLSVSCNIGYDQLAQCK